MQTEVQSKSCSVHSFYACPTN